MPRVFSVLNNKKNFLFFFMAVTIASAMFGPCFEAGLISKYLPRCTDQVQYYYAVRTELSVLLKHMSSYFTLFFYTAITCH